MAGWCNCDLAVEVVGIVCGSESEYLRAHAPKAMRVHGRFDDIKVMHLTGGVSRLAGGPFQSVRRAAQELAVQGCSVSVAGLRDSLSEVDRAQWAPIAPDVFGGMPKAAYGWSPGWRGALQRAVPDVVHVHGVWLAHSSVAANWCRQNRRPLIISPRGMLEPWALQFRAWKKAAALRLVEMRNLRQAACLHATADLEVASLRSLGLSGPIAVIPNGVDLPDVGSRPHGAPGRRRALFLSRIHPKKGIPMLLRAWALVRPDGWELVIAGPDECGHTAELQTMSRSLGIAEQVTFSGPKYGEDKDAMFGSADLFVLPTHSENFGIAVAEALSWGVPVVTTTGTPWSVLESERCGWWVAATVDGISRALRTAFSAPAGELEEMGKRGRAVVEDRFSWPSIASQFVAVYRWILGRGAIPSCVVER